MESMLGFDEHVIRNDAVEDNFFSYKLVPWTSWDEWKFVRESIFSSSPDSVSSAIRRITTWRSRGCVPVSIEITASIVEIQQKDPYFRKDSNDSISQSEEMITMLYCMAIMRLVNGVVEKTRNKNEISLGEAADAIGIPRMLIDIRHESSHRDLPSLRLLRLASNKALDWLVSYYWEPQGNAISIQNDQTANLRKEIKRRICELSLSMKAKKLEKSSSSHVNEKRVRKLEHLYGRSKFLTFVAGKPSHIISSDCTKQLRKSLKKALRLYSSFSSEFVHILLEHLINGLDPSKPECIKNQESVEDNKQTAFDDWKSVVLKLSRREPDFLLTLTQALLEKMETTNAVDCEIDVDHQAPEKSRNFESLSYLLAWLIGILKALNPASQRESAEIKKSKTLKTGNNLTEAEVFALLRRCLLLSSPENKQLKGSSITLARLTGNTSLYHKLKKLALVSNPQSNPSKSFKGYSIQQAKEKLELIRRRVKGKYGKSNLSELVGVKRKWAVVESWSLCPIGMLPSKIGFSGRLPDLEVVALSDSKKGGCERRLAKREAESGVEEIDTRLAKKLEIEATGDHGMMQDEGDVSGGVKGHLMIDGTWTEVGEEEVFAIASAVKLLV